MRLRYDPELDTGKGVEERQGKGLQDVQMVRRKRTERQEV